MLADYLKNLKVVELSSVLAGPAVGMFFAELGAQVTKIENKPAGGDLTRKWKLPSEDPAASISAYFASVNYGKIHLMADFKNAHDLAMVREKISHADIVIVNFKKGDEEKFGLSYQEVAQLNSTIIYAHITGYGPHESKTAFDVVLQAETGFMYMNGTPASGPVKMPVALIDLMAAHQVKEAVLLALIKKQQTGKGSYVHTSLYASAIASLANQASNYLMCAHVPQPMGTLHPNIAPYGEMLPTKDGALIVLAVGTDTQFKSLCTALDLQALASDERFATNTARVQHRHELQELLSAPALQQNSEQLLQKLLNYQVPHGRVNNMQQVFEHALAQNMVLTGQTEGQSTTCVSTIAFDRDFIKD